MSILKGELRKKEFWLIKKRLMPQSMRCVRLRTNQSFKDGDVMMAFYKGPGKVNGIWSHIPLIFNFPLIHPFFPTPSLSSLTLFFIFWPNAKISFMNVSYKLSHMNSIFICKRIFSLLWYESFYMHKSRNYSANTRSISFEEIWCCMPKKYACVCWVMIYLSFFVVIILHLKLKKDMKMSQRFKCIPIYLKCHLKPFHQCIKRDYD